MTVDNLTVYNETAEEVFYRRFLSEFSVIFYFSSVGPSCNRTFLALSQFLSLYFSLFNNIMKREESFSMAQYEDIPGRVFADLPFDPEFGLDLREQPKWDVPEKIIVKAALVGSPIKRTTNPHQPYTTDEIRKESIGCIEAGATSIHFHPREDDGSVVLDPERYLDKLRRIIEPIKETYGDRIIIDGCTATLAFPGEAALIKSGLFEEAPVNCYSVAPRRLVEAQAQIMQENGVKPQIATYCDGDIDRAKRWLIDAGLVEKPL